MALAVGIFVLALAAIASERVDRTKVALLGASLVVVTQTIEQEQAIEAIDFNTIGLLAGMMLIVNLTTILLMVPITFLLADALDIDPIPLVIIEIIASNIGGTATLIGDPPNIIIAGATGLSFSAFIFNLAPVAAVTFVLVTGGLYLAYRHR